MKRMLLAGFTIAVGLYSATALTTAPRDCRADEPAAGERDIKELIAQLGSPSFEAREEATRRLMGREDAGDALRAALKSGDAEVARRAREILDAFARKERKRAFAAFAGAAKRGAVDEAVERLVRREKWDDEAACWRAMAGLVDRLTGLEKETYQNTGFTGLGRVGEEALPLHLKLFRLKIIGAGGGCPALWEGHIVLRAEEVRADDKGDMIACSLFAVSGGVRLISMTSSVVFAGGAVAFSGSSVDSSVIVCDGDFTARSIFKCLVIARGTIRCDDGANDSHLISGGRVEFKHPERVHGSKVVEKEAKPLGFVTFFDPAEVGIKVESAEGGVRVKEAEKGKAFAAAGLRADDLVTALDGEAVKDAESFRRRLRARLAVEGTMTFQVRRGDKPLEVAVPHKD